MDSDSEKSFLKFLLFQFGRIDG